MNKKKNHASYIGMLVALFFVCACGGRPVGEGTATVTMPPAFITESLGTVTPEPIGPTKQPEITPEATPSPILSPSLAPSPVFTPTPELAATPEPTEGPTPEPTKAPTLQPTEGPTPQPTEAPTTQPTKTPTPQPTKVPTPEPTEGPTPQPTKALTPEPTKTPTPTKEERPEPTKVVEPSPSLEPVPSINPLPLVHAGWQNVLDILADHYIIFPECFDGSAIEQKDSRLVFVYTSSADETISFSIIYTIGQTCDAAEEEIYAQGGVIEQHLPEEKSFSYILEQNGMVFYGWTIEESYSRELLGEEYQNEEIPGTMRVGFSYPILRREQYETEAFRYYIVRIE